jgi:4-amino-4-deoxy-L-arabinose transferase-like glycosyltransferase
VTATEGTAGPRAGRLLLCALAALALTRLLSLPLYPLMDTTEARYADIARRMLAQGDWVTPWFGDGVPFWGKPPLSFWATELGFTVFGVNEWGARLPHFVLGVAVAALVWMQARTVSQRAAWHSVALLAGAALFLVSSGAVVTDMALTLGNTMVMIGFLRAWRGGAPGASTLLGPGWLLAGGAIIGLLAKGPVSVVLWGLPLLGWALMGGRLRRVWSCVPWLRGALVVTALSLPWYALAEMRTPGFLQYFIVGEHWQRFVTPGWAGDLYGHAHKYPYGTIWMFAAGATLPWSVLLPAAWLALARRQTPITRAPPPRGDEAALLLAWALAPCVFFTAAGNVLWTYVLPGLPPLAIWVGCWTASRQRERLAEGVLTLGLALCTLSIVGLLTAAHRSEHFERKSAHAFVQDYRSHAAAGERLYFLGKVPFSGSFYSAGQAQAIANLDALPAGTTAWVVVNATDLAVLPPVQRERLEVVSQIKARVLARWR